jgi:hypothetical protein
VKSLAQRVISDLRTNGLPLEEVGDGWFAIHIESRTGRLSAFLYLVDQDIERYLDGISAEDVDGVFGPNVTPADAGYRLTLIHIEELLHSFHGGIRYVVVDGEQIRFFDSGPLPNVPPGDYEWRAQPRL